MRTGAGGRRYRGVWRGALAIALVVAGSGCANDPGNFSQYPGFSDWYERNPPAAEPPAAADRALLARYEPRFFLPEGQEGPIDFYADYIAAGTLRDGDGEVVADEVTQAVLNDHAHDPTVVFVHDPDAAPVTPTPVVYGRIDREPVPLPGCAEPLPVAFLTYHLVFRASGLPAGMSDWQELALAAAGDLDDWHQLDHYTAVTITVAEEGEETTPFAATFQHHNYLRTWILGDTAGDMRLVLPEDGRLPVDVAIRSNELYPHRPGRTERRAVRFLDPDSATYLVTGEDQPFAAADDVTDPVLEVDPDLRFLPPADAFYVFAGWLGERRMLPGRDGPPGADYNTLPALKPKPVQLMAFLWGDDDQAYLELLAEVYAEGRPERLELAPFAERFAARLADARPDLLAC